MRMRTWKRRDLRGARLIHFPTVSRTVEWNGTRSWHHETRAGSQSLLWLNSHLTHPNNESELGKITRKYLEKFTVVFHTRRHFLWDYTNSQSNVCGYTQHSLFQVKVKSGCQEWCSCLLGLSHCNAWRRWKTITRSSSPQAQAKVISCRTVLSVRVSHAGVSLTLILFSLQSIQ